MRDFETRGLTLSVVLWFAILIGGCVFAPYALRDPNSMSPPGQIEPVPGADSNPLDTPRVIYTRCTPQNHPIVDSSILQECEEHPDCQVICSMDPERERESEAVSKDGED
jgi:hypothetical protein